MLAAAALSLAAQGPAHFSVICLAPEAERAAARLVAELPTADWYDALSREEREELRKIPALASLDPEACAASASSSSEPGSPLPAAACLAGFALVAAARRSRRRRTPS